MNRPIETTNDEGADMAADPASVFLTRLLETPEGREHMLSVSVDAEEGDESGIFDQLADAVDVPELRRIVEQHRDDEVRHAGLFRACLARNGFAKTSLPPSMMVVRQVAERTDGDGSVSTTDDIVSTYALLLAIEERGVAQFPRIADAFEPHDPDTAEVYRRVARDERGHVRYCQRIGRHYAGDDRRWDDAVAQARAIEADAFTHAGLANVHYCAEKGWVRLDEVLTGTSTVAP
jgi:rubrerythrin